MFYVNILCVTKRNEIPKTAIYRGNKQKRRICGVLCLVCLKGFEPPTYCDISGFFGSCVAFRVAFSSKNSDNLSLHIALSLSIIC